MQLLNLLKREENKEKTGNNMLSNEKIEIDPEQEKAETAAELTRQKQWIDHKIKNFERKETDDKIRTALRQLQDVHDAMGDMQYALNTLWKRTHQITEELKQALEVPMPSLNSHPQNYPQ